MELPYTAAAVGAVLLILQIGLMMNTGLYRGKVMIGVGVEGDKDLERRMRRHGNLAENAAIFVVVLALTEGLFGSDQITAAFGVAFVVARLSHAVAFSSLAGSHVGEEGAKIYPRLRIVGALGTALCGIGLGFYLLVQLLM